MPRGRRRLTVVCAESGCGESVFYEYPNLTEYADGAKRHKGWKCTRHERPERNLRPGNEVTRVTLTAVKVPFKSDFKGGREFLDGLFWRMEGAEHAGSGYAYGPGFNAHARDFPEGTMLVVTAQILPPEEDEPVPVDGDCPESKLDTGSHGSDWYGGGRCSWCGDLGPLDYGEEANDG